jgi:hypothetical protein
MNGENLASCVRWAGRYGDGEEQQKMEDIVIVRFLGRCTCLLDDHKKHFCSRGMIFL